MMRKLFGLHRSQKGITGLETAIILIAFVVVAAVFAYTVLSAGLFATQKSQESVYQGLEETASTLEIRGDVLAYKGDANISNSIGKVEFVLTNAVSNGEPIDLTAPYAINGGTGALEASGNANPCQIAFTDVNTTIANGAWTLSWIGKDDGDNLLENNEKAVITVWLHAYDGAAWSAGANPPFLAANVVDTYHKFDLEVKPANGAVLIVERTTPAALDTVNNLH